jgi:hypothetical protein
MEPSERKSRETAAEPTGPTSTRHLFRVLGPEDGYLSQLRIYPDGMALEGGESRNLEEPDDLTGDAED